MGSDTDKGQALKLLTGLENGSLSTGEARVIAEQLDPVLVYLIVHHLRESHPRFGSRRARRTGTRRGAVHQRRIRSKVQAR